MTTVLFVHGTGVRRPKYEKDFQRVKSELQNRLSNLKVEHCLWGDAVGAKLHHQGLSIPFYDTSGGHDQATIEEIEIELWRHLYADSLYELRVLAIKSGAKRSMIGNVALADELDKLVGHLPISRPLHIKLQEAEIDGVFEQAQTNVRDSVPYREMLQTISTSIEIYQTAIARAIIAEAIALASQHQQ